MSEALIHETFDYLLAAAKGALSEGHSFAPFGAGVRGSGERIHLGLDLADQPPDPQSHIAHIVAALREDARGQDLRVAALALDGEVRLDSGDAATAILMHIEVKGGECLEAVIAYVREPGGTIAYFDPVFAPSDHEVFRA